MRLVLLILMLGGNAIGYFLFTRPSFREAAREENQARRLAEISDGEAAKLARLRELERVVDLEKKMLPRSSGETAIVRDFSGIRRLLLEAERGLALQRTMLQVSPENQLRAGYRGYRVRLVERGDFAEIYAYLQRLERIPAPLAPVTLSLVAEPGSASPSLLLTIELFALASEEPS